MELAERLLGTGVTVNCVHPGGVDTKLKRAGFGPGGMSVEQGALPIVHLVAAPGLASLSGSSWQQSGTRPLDVRFAAVRAL